MILFLGRDGPYGAARNAIPAASVASKRQFPFKDVAVRGVGSRDRSVITEPNLPAHPRSVMNEYERENVPIPAI